MRPVSTAILTRSRSGQPPTTLAIVGDRRLSVAALAALLLGDPAYQQVDDARGKEPVQQALARYQPSVVVVESNGVSLREAMEAAQTSGRILLLLDPEAEPSVFNAAVRWQAPGYLSRSAARQSLEKAIDSIRETGYYLDPLLVGRMLAVSKEPVTPRRPELSQRERDILVRIASGRSTKEVARELAIAAKTVGNHVSNISQKLNVKHRGELVLYAVEQGLSTVER
jgi:DNA-binding NarL/FixJ family response regulator